MKSYDCIVIGAGNGGLAAAVTILQGGKTCLLLEKHNLPGGFASSFRRGRFEFESALHEFNGIGTTENPGSSRELFDRLGVSSKIDWVQIKDAYHLISREEGYDFVMPFGVDNFCDACEKLVKGGSKMMHDFFSICDEIKAALDYLGTCHGKPDTNYIVEHFPSFLRTGSYSVNEVMNALSMPQILKDNFAAYWCYLGTDFDNMSFTHYANMMSRYIELGAVIPKARSNEISLAFDSRIRELKGDIWYNSEVTKIICDENHKVSGVQLKDGRIVNTHHVICNFSLHTLLSHMMDEKDISKKALKLANSRKIAGRGFVLYLGLNKSPEELGIKDHNYFIYTTSNNVKQYEDMNTFKDNCVQATVCLNNAIKDCSPKGTTVLYMTTLFTSNIWDDVKLEDYKAKKEEVSRALIKRFEEATHTNIHDYIEEIEIASPVTFARYGGHPEGAIYGYESIYNDGLLARTMMVNDDALNNGIRLGGGFGERLLGFPSSYKSGVNEAKRTLKDMEAE